MDIRALGYIGVAVADLGVWRSYAELSGTMVVPSDSDDEFRIKIDDRPYRVLVQRSDVGEGLALAGWELPDAAALEQAAAELAAPAIRASSPLPGSGRRAGCGDWSEPLTRAAFGWSPSGFDVEFGCGGLRIDDATWTVSEITKPSFWATVRRSPARPATDPELVPVAVVAPMPGSPRPTVGSAESRRARQQRRRLGPRRGSGAG